MEKTDISPRNSTTPQKQVITGLTEYCPAAAAESSIPIADKFFPSSAFVVPRNGENDLGKDAVNDPAAITVRSAVCLADLDAIESLVNHWANLGENLPRERSEIIDGIDSFVVCEEQGMVTGCASLYLYDSRLAEIRSLGVYEGAQRRGQGKALVAHLVEKARQMAVEKVFVLTRVPEFFEKQGFTLTSRALLPEKTRKDCERCPRQHCCDEVALEVCFEQ